MSKILITVAANMKNELVSWLEQKHAQYISCQCVDDDSYQVSWNTEPGHAGRKRRLNDEECLQMRESGLSFSQIAQNANATKSSVFAACRRAKNQRKANARAERAAAKAKAKLDEERELYAKAGFVQLDNPFVD